MKEAFYLGEYTTIVNFSKEYYSSTHKLVSSQGFRTFLTSYFQQLQGRDPDTYAWITHNRPLDDFLNEFIVLIKMLLSLDLDEIKRTNITEMNRVRVLYVVEDCYKYWRSKQRFSIVNAGYNRLMFMSFRDADTKFNDLILSMYRTLQEKLQGKTNIVYRQLQAGSNACACVKNYVWDVPDKYAVLKDIPFIYEVMLRTPIMFHPACNKRTGTFTEVPENPIDDFDIDIDDWYCMPIKVGDLLGYVYFYKDYMANGVSLANLFEVASEAECTNRKPDLICLFGKQDGKEDCTFYHDEANDIWIGSVSDHFNATYFGYIKKAVLTLHNLAKMQKGCLPIHGSMMEIRFKNGNTKSLVLIGDSGAGKSESIEAVKTLAAKETGGNAVAEINVVFDDMGSMKIVNNHVVANGTETGAFVRLDDLDSSTAYQDIERSIFLTSGSNNARVIEPITNYNNVIVNHKIDMVLYANNYESRVGVERFEKYEDGKQVFMDGKRWALGTTQEKGLTSTFFANPFGPMQKQELCTEIMGEIFGQLYEDGVYVGQIFTNLGTDHKENLTESAKCLLDLLRK